MIERAKILAADRKIVVADLPLELEPTWTNEGTVESLPDDLESLQKSKVVDVLNRVGGNKARAARMLGITRRSLYRLLERFDLR